MLSPFRALQKLRFMKKALKTLVIAAFMAVPAAVWAQGFAVKSNLLYDATATINLGAELAVAPKWSVDISGNLNPWTFDDGKRWKHWLVQPEARYWFCQPYTGHFVGAHLLGGQYNIGGIDLGDFKFLGTNLSNLKDNRYQGWFVGAGVAYGYSWLLGRHWNLEAEIGFGWAYTRFDTYPCAHCGTKKSEDRPHNYVGPTKAALSLVYVF